jgi:hypothetical protein
MHALNARRVHPDLELRPRQRQIRDSGGIELEGECPAIAGRQELVRNVARIRLSIVRRIRS